MRSWRTILVPYDAQLSSGARDQTPLVVLQVTFSWLAQTASPGFCSDWDFGFLCEGIAEGNKAGERVPDLGARQGHCLAESVHKYLMETGHPQQHRHHELGRGSGC